MSMASTKYKKDEFELKFPPIFENYEDLLKEYLLKPEKLPIHKWERSQTHWHRENNEETYISLLDDCDYEEPDSILEVVRDLATGEIIGIEEINISIEDEECKSMSRRPLPPNLATRGTSLQSPFIPAGFEEDLKKMLENRIKGIIVNTEHNEPGKFLGEDLLTTAPGARDSVLFAEDGMSLLNQSNTETVAIQKDVIDMNVDLEQIIANNAQFADLWKDDEDINRNETRNNAGIEQNSEEDNDFLQAIIVQPPVELPEIPVLRISNSSARTVVMSTQWAEVIDVSQPVPEFKENAITFPFELDNFQKQAILKLEEGHHVFVAAHTSAGKTVVAEYAIAMSRRNSTRTVYTSPIKALSNQKYNDFNKQFGEVGLLTGDLQINTSSSCLVMTTEILRSMLYCGSDVTRDLEFVIFDEVHYINNAERGHVWEEVLILLPAHVSIVMLSATVPNTLQFADWVGRTKRRKVFVVSTPKRPVPLCHYLYTGTNGKTKNERFLVINSKNEFQPRGYNDAVAAKKSRESDYKRNNGPRGGKFMSPKAEQTMWVALIDHLKTNDKLPVVAFTLSRNRCDKNAENLLTTDLTTAKEKSYIRYFFKRCLLRLKEPDRELPQVLKLQRVLENGIGIHHSGILPLLKEIVEMLFQSGHVKILFATETFAMGINMPARTVVFDETTKYDGVERRTLTPAEYTQMAGRAGRRGLDDTGTVIILCKESVPDLAVLKEMMLGTPQQLSSRFRLTYEMILGLLRVATVSVEGMMQRSFGEIQKICESDNYKKQLQIAEQECSKKCSKPLASHQTPLATFYDTATAYINALDIMHVLLTQPKVTKEFTPGRVLLLSAGRHINELGIYLNSSGPRLTPYKVLVLNTAVRDAEECELTTINGNWYRMLGLSSMYDGFGTEECTLDHTIICIGATDIIAVTKTNIKIDEKIIIKDFEQRQIPRFKDAPMGATCAAAVQELSRLSHAVRSGATVLEEVNLTSSLTITSAEILQNLDDKKRLENELEAVKKYTNIANFKSEFAMVYERRQAEAKRDKYKHLLSFESLTLYPEYQSRLMVLRELRFIDDHDNVMLKGRVACVMGTNGLIITELIFRNIFTVKEPAEIAAILSCFVFQARTCIALDVTERLMEGIRDVAEIDDEVASIEKKFSVDPFEGQSERINFGLVRVIYEWARGKPFAEIMEITDVQEGIIVRCIQQLYEILVGIKDAAVIIGDPLLQAKMVEASAAIKRDIVFAASLYTSQKDINTI